MATTLTGTLTDAVLKVYSADILYEALPTMQWLEFAVIREDLTVREGSTISFLKYDDLDGDSELTEGTPMVPSALANSLVEIVVTEHGRASSFSEKLVSLSWDDQLANAAHVLGRHYARFGPDFRLKLTAAADAPTTFYAGGGVDRTTITAADTMDTDLIRDAVEELQTQNAPKFNTGDDQFYVCMLHPHQARYIRQDPDWVAAAQYAGSRNIFTGEIGRFEDVVFIVSSACFNGTAAATSEAFLDLNSNGTNDLESGEAGNAVDIYLASLFGDAYLGFASAVPVELRDNGVVDFGRQHDLAWYSIYGTGLIVDTNGVNIETA